MSRRIRWPIVKKFYWCTNCNIPLVIEKCPRCGSTAIRIPLTDPGDARLAFERDYKRLEEAYRFEFGTTKGLKQLLGNSVMLLNKAPYADEMKEVYVDGVQIGRLYFDPLMLRWRFRLSKAGALRVLDADPDIVPKLVVTKKRYIPMDVIRTDREFEPKKQVLLVRPDGKPVGLGYAKGRNRVVVHSWWGDEAPDYYALSTTKSTIDDVIKAHEEHMRVMESRSKKLIAVMYEKVGKPIVASFSGGKDSLVALHLALELGYKMQVLFNNTGIELPETVETVYKIVDKFGLELVEASAGDAFWRTVWFFGPPGRDYRWCCKILKLTPLLRAIKQHWSNGALNVVGQRAFESLDRARNPSVWRLQWAPYMLNVSPINYWSQFEVWLYIYAKKLDVNPLYFMGYERIGCFMCPASTLAELVLVSETHKDIWSRWLEVLEYWAKRLDLPREWIDYALWRWAAPARYRTYMAKKLRIADRIDDWRTTFLRWVAIPIERVERTSDRIEVVFGSKLDLKAIEDQITVLSPHRYVIDVEKGYAVLEWSYAKITIENGVCVSLEYSEEHGVERLVDLLKAVYKYMYCVGCRSCEYNCPMSVYKVVVENGRFVPKVVDPKRCIRCRVCLHNCPIAEVYVEHIVIPVILGDPEAWRRKTREHLQDVLRKIKSVLKIVKPEVFTSPKPAEKPSDYAPTANFFESL